ncbi:MAG TPA: hypothetical protein VIV15_00370, partial [Anaerolineales bacterium]
SLLSVSKAGLCDTDFLPAPTFSTGCFILRTRQMGNREEGGGKPASNFMTGHSFSSHLLWARPECQYAIEDRNRQIAESVQRQLRRLVLSFTNPPVTKPAVVSYPSSMPHGQAGNGAGKDVL